VSYLSESSIWRQRRRRRQQVTMTVIVLLVVAIGVVAYGYSQGWLGDPADDVTTGSVPACTPSTAAPLTASGVHVNVYNSTSRDGLASTVADALRARSFAVGTVANDPLHADVTGTALIRYGSKGLAAARMLAAQVPKSTMRHDKRKGTEVDLVLGDAFKALSPAVTPTGTATSAPSVRCTPAPTPTRSGTSASSPTASSRASTG
jgi:hypothetical protein